MSEYTSREELIEELLASGETRTEYGWDKAIDAVLEIIENNKYIYVNFVNSIGESKYPQFNKMIEEWNECLDEIMSEIKALKGGEQE